MSQQIQELINKIKSDGINAADQQAKEMEQKAKQEAAGIVENAKKEAEQLIVNAKEEVKKLQESTHMALRQASRDTILSLRKEVEHTLKKVVEKEVGDALTPSALSDIITTVAKNASTGKAEQEDVLLKLNAKDLDKLKSGFISKLQKQLKQGLKVKASEDVGKGFFISFDSGRSSFDFTDESLAQYISTFLNAHVASLVEEAAQEEPAAV